MRYRVVISVIQMKLLASLKPIDSSGVNMLVKPVKTAKRETGDGSYE